MVKAESRPIVCTSQLDTHPGGNKDAVDSGTIPIIHDPAYPASDSGTEEDSDGGDTELEWDGHYSSSYLSSGMCWLGNGYLCACMGIFFLCVDAHLWLF